MIIQSDKKKEEQSGKAYKKKNNEMPENAILSYKVWFGYGVGHVFNDLCASMWFTYLLIFFIYVQKFGNVLAGTTLFIGQLADGISTPIVGLFSDKKTNSWLCKYGRRKTWHLLGTVCVLVSFPFIFSRCYGCERFDHIQKLIYYSVFIIIFQFGWASAQISHLSLVPELTPNEHERTSLLTLRYCFTVISNIVVYLVTWFIFHVHRYDVDDVIGPKDEHKFQVVSYVVVCIGIVMSLLFHLCVKENHVILDDSEPLTENNVSRSSLLQCGSFYNVACVYMATRLFVNLSQIYIPLYLQGYLHLPSESLAILPLVMFISSFMTSGIIKPLNMQFGRKTAYLLGAILGLGACIWIKVGNDYYFRNYEIYGVVATFGCASSIMLVTSLGITADLIGSNTDNGAFIYGLMSFSDKISNGLAVILIQSLKCTDDCPVYYRDVLLLSCGGAAIFGLISIATTRSSDSIENTYQEREVEVGEDETLPENPIEEGEQIIK